MCVFKNMLYVISNIKIEIHTLNNMSMKVLIIQGPPCRSRVSFALLTLQDSVLRVENCSGDIIDTLQLKAYIPGKILLRAGQTGSFVFTYCYTPVYRRIEFQAQLNFTPEVSFVARSCDSTLVSSKARKKIINKLTNIPNTTPLFTIGDAIYADHGYVKERANTTLQEYRRQYVNAWVDTFDSIVHITANRSNILLADDHELWDNASPYDSKSSTKLSVGHTVLNEIYRSFMGDFRQFFTDGNSATCTPYDNYSFVSGDAVFAFLGKGPHLPSALPFLWSLNYPQAKRLTVLTGPSCLSSRGEIWERAYYHLRCRKRPAQPELFDLWKVLNTLHKKHFIKSVQLVGGDLHHRLQATKGGVGVIITSPFSNVSLGDPGMREAVNEVHQDLNFAILSEGAVRFETQGLSWCDYFRTFCNFLVSLKSSPRVVE
jgi:hypothetical protein